MFLLFCMISELSSTIGSLSSCTNESNSIKVGRKIIINMDLQEEKQLVEDAKSHSESFAKLYDHYFPRVFAYVAAKVRDKSNAEDITSDVFIKVLENLDSFEWRGIPFAAWLFTIARNTVNNFYTKNNKGQTLELDEGRFIENVKNELSPKEKATQQELSENVKKVLKSLPERELNVVQLKFFSQLNNREIVAVTGLSESNVAVILYRTLKRIKPDLKYFA